MAVALFMFLLIVDTKDICISTKQFYGASKCTESAREIERENNTNGLK